MRHDGDSTEMSKEAPRKHQAHTKETPRYTPSKLPSVHPLKGTRHSVAQCECRGMFVNVSLLPPIFALQFIIFPVMENIHLYSQHSHPRPPDSGQEYWYIREILYQSVMRQDWPEEMLRLTRCHQVSAPLYARLLA